MIEKLNEKNKIDVLEFVNDTKDIYEEFYITKNKNRIYLNNYDDINKVLSKQDIFGLFDKNLKGVLMIYREKGFRPYVKILTKDREIEKKLVKFLIWNFSNIDLYIKLKKSNPLSRYLTIINKFTKKPQFGFVFSGDRGNEILLFRKGEPKVVRLGDKNE